LPDPVFSFRPGRWWS